MVESRAVLPFLHVLLVLSSREGEGRLHGEDQQSSVVAKIQSGSRQLGEVVTGLQDGGRQQRSVAGGSRVDGSQPSCCREHSSVTRITHYIGGIEQGWGIHSVGDDKLSSIFAITQGSSIQQGGGLSGSRGEGRQ